MFDFILPMTRQCSMEWPSVPYAKLPNMLIANTHVVWTKFLFN